MKGILVRVGIDSTYGNWNAPVNPSNNDFVYVPIPESETHIFKLGMRITYDDYIPEIKEFNRKYRPNNAISLPKILRSLPVHLDPDFNYTSYGDNGRRRGKRLKDLFQEGDFIVFYAGLRPTSIYKNPLMYAVIGFYLIEKVTCVGDIMPEDTIKNAHTRIKNPEPSDVVVFGKRSISGRLKNCIPVGEYRDRAYRVRKDLLKTWGGLSVKDGYLQRSAVPPTFNEPEKFLKWFRKQNVSLINSNN